MIWLFACGTDEPRGDDDDDAVVEVSGCALSGEHLLRTSHPEVEVGQTFTPDERLVFDLVLPERIRGYGRPPPPEPGTAWYDDDAFWASLQLELPAPKNPLTDEEETDELKVEEFNRPRFCLGDGACPQRDTPGFWRVSNIVEDADGSCVSTDLFPSLNVFDRATRFGGPPQILSVWAEDDLPKGSIVRFEYIGRVPRRATDWDDSLQLHPGVRWRTCDQPGIERECFRELTDAEVQPLEIRAGPTAFVRVQAPLDLVDPARTEVRVVLLDASGNPTRRTLAVPVVDLDGNAVCEVRFTDAYSATCTGAVRGSTELTAVLPPVLADATVVQQPVRVAEGPWQRLVGDLHIHSGLRTDDGDRQTFLHTGGAGDHGTQRSGTERALRYLRDVSGYDFGAVSEHAVPARGYDLATESPAAAADPFFAEGAPCDVASRITDVDPWWPVNQRTAREFDAASDGFVGFPAYEWHGTFQPSGPPLHRIVLFRDFHPADAHPLLAISAQVVVPPQCVVRFLELSGLPASEALVMPHMMFARPDNDDWRRSYSGTGLLVASKAAVQERQTVGEIVSARNPDIAHRLPERATHTIYEAPAGQPWAFRTAWRDFGATIGLIGSSDNHTAMPGVDDTPPGPDTPAARYHRHDPAGTAVVLAEGRDRDSIFAALRARRTYATSGIRAWLDYRVDGAPMGSEITACGEAKARIELHSPLPLLQVQLFASQVGGTAEFEPVHDAFLELNTSDHVATVDLAEREGRWLYYVRAFAGTPDFPHADAIWSSPVWVDWCE